MVPVTSEHRENVLSVSEARSFLQMKCFYEIRHQNVSHCRGYTGTGSGTETISGSVSGSSPSSSSLRGKVRYEKRICDVF